MFKIGDKVAVLKDDYDAKAGMIGIIQDESPVPYVYIKKLGKRVVLSEENLQLVVEDTEEINKLKEELIKKDVLIANLKGQLTAYEKIFKLSAGIKK